MKLLREFLKSRDGSIAIQFSIVALPLIALGGVGIDYSRISVVKSNLQSTLDNNIRSMSPRDFANRKAMEDYIVALANVNLESKTVSANISVYQNVLRVDLRDVVKTPSMSLLGRPEVEVLASLDIKQQPTTSTTQLTNAASSLGSSGTVQQASRSQINKAKASVRSSIARINKSKYLSGKRKRQIISRLRKQLENLKKL